MFKLIELRQKWTIENVNLGSLASDEALHLFQKNNNVVLPNDLIKYFKTLNGTHGDYTDELYEFYSIERISNVKEEFKNWRGIPHYQLFINIDKTNELYVFANFNFNLFVYAIKLYPDSSNQNEIFVLCGNEYKQIASSFSDFIELYLEDSIELQLNKM